MTLYCYSTVHCAQQGLEEAGEKGAQILCLQEIFYGPYFCAEQDIKWYQTAEKVPGPTVELLSEYAKKYQMVMIILLFEILINMVSLDYCLYL